jgi:hypothetical protein
MECFGQIELNNLQYNFGMTAIKLEKFFFTFRSPEILGLGEMTGSLLNFYFGLITLVPWRSLKFQA